MPDPNPRVTPKQATGFVVGVISLAASIIGIHQWLTAQDAQWALIAGVAALCFLIVAALLFVASYAFGAYPPQPPPSIYIGEGNNDPTPITEKRPLGEQQPEVTQLDEYLHIKKIPNILPDHAQTILVSGDENGVYVEQQQQADSRFKALVHYFHNYPLLRQDGKFLSGRVGKAIAISAKIKFDMFEPNGGFILAHRGLWLNHSEIALDFAIDQKHALVIGIVDKMNVWCLEREFTGVHTKGLSRRRSLSVHGRPFTIRGVEVTLLGTDAEAIATYKFILEIYYNFDTHNTTFNMQPAKTWLRSKLFGLEIAGRDLLNEAWTKPDDEEVNVAAEKWVTEVGEFLEVHFGLGQRVAFEQVNPTIETALASLLQPKGRLFRNMPLREAINPRLEILQKTAKSL